MKRSLFLLMKFKYFLIFLWFVFNFYSCQDRKERTTDVQDPEADQKRLDERIALTSRKWDSLEEILHEESLGKVKRDSVKKLIFDTRYAQEEIIKEFIRENSNSAVSISKLNGFKFTWGKEVTRALFNTLTPEVQNSEKGKNVSKYLRFYNKPEVGDRFTDFELPNLQGKVIKFSEEREKYTLMEFWAAWCMGCREKHPELIEVYEKFKDQGFTVIGISGDKNEKNWKTAVKKDKLPWLNLRGKAGRESVVQFQYGIHYLPTNFLIGPDGKIIAKDVDSRELDKILTRI